MGEDVRWWWAEKWAAEPGTKTGGDEVWLHRAMAGIALRDIRNARRRWPDVVRLCQSSSKRRVGRRWMDRKTCDCASPLPSCRSPGAGPGLSANDQAVAQLFDSATFGTAMEQHDSTASGTKKHAHHITPSYSISLKSSLFAVCNGYANVLPFVTQSMWLASICQCRPIIKAKRLKPLARQ